MSSCFNGDGHARQLRWMVVGLVLLATGAADAHAQTIDGQPFAEGAFARTTLGGAPLRLWHRTEGYGQEASETAFGGRGAFDLGGAVGFTDGQFRVSNQSRFGANLGGGVRWYGDDFLVGQPRIFGISGWYDGQETILNNYFNQGGVSFESLGEYIDFRLNANIPFEDQKLGDDQFVTGGLNFSGNSLAQATLTPADVSLRVVDFEVAPRVMDLNLWVYGGGYQMDGNGISETGAKAGFRGYLTNDLAIDVGVTDDEVFHTNTVFQIIWTPGRTGAGPTSWIHSLADRMREPVYRNTYIATDQRLIEGSMALADAAGDELRIVHVDSDAAPGGDGTFENPLSSLDAIDENSQQGDVILVHADSTFSGQTALLINEQRFLGEGGGNRNTITTSQLGTINIPETFANATNAARPVITNGDTVDSVVLTSSTADAATFSPIEVSNFDFVDGRSAIATTTGVGAVNINRLDITSTASHAIALTPITETTSTGGQRLRFAPTIDEITLTDIGGDGILLTDASTVPSGTQSTGTIAISDITSTNPGNVATAGAGIRLDNIRRTATINGFDWNGGTTGEGALSIEDATAQGNVTLSGDNLLTGGRSTATETAGYAINLVDSANTVTVTGTTITDTGGDSIIVDDGTSDLNFTGRINKGAGGAATASIVSVLDGHDGDLTLVELTEDAGVINATSGDGLQFNDADGTYTFTDRVILTGTSAAVNVQNGSAAEITIADGQFTDTTGDTVTVNGGTADLSFTGRISQTANDALVLNVSGGHSVGALTFEELTDGAGVINATMGDGLLFDNADGDYRAEDGAVVLAGDAGIEVRGGSSGTFAFTDTDNAITNPSGNALVIQNSSANFTFDGAITTDSTSGRPVLLTGNTGGGISIRSTVNSTDDGILIEDNTGGTITFFDQVTLNTTTNVTPTNDAVVIRNNTGGSVQFNNIDITTTTGDGFFGFNNTGTSSITVLAGSGNTITTTTGTGLSLNNVIVGTQGITFASINTDGAANGIVLNNVTGGPVNIGSSAAAMGASGTIANSTGAGVMITNASNVAINGLTVDGAGADGIDIDHNGAATSVVRINNTTVTDTVGNGIDYNRSASVLSRLTLNGNVINNNQETSVLMNIAGSGTQDITIHNGNEIANSSNDSALVITTSGSSNTTNILIDGNDFDNNDATNATAVITAGSSGTMNTTVTSNSFDNAGAARSYVQTSTAGTVRLDLNGNEATTAGVNDEYLLNEVGGDFSVVDLATVDDNNEGDVEIMGTIEDEEGTVTRPQP